MKVYQFDVTLQGMVIADTREDAVRYILGLGRDDSCIDIDDRIDLKLLEIPPQRLGDPS